MTLFSKIGVLATLLVAFRERRSGYTSLTRQVHASRRPQGRPRLRRSPFFNEDTTMQVRIARVWRSPKSARVKSILKVIETSKNDPASPILRDGRENLDACMQPRIESDCVSDRTHEPTRACSERAADTVESLASWTAIVRAVLPEQAQHVTVPARFVVVEEARIVSAMIDVDAQVDRAVHLAERIQLAAQAMPVVGPVSPDAPLDQGDILKGIPIGTRELMGRLASTSTFDSFLCSRGPATHVATSSSLSRPSAAYKLDLTPAPARQTAEVRDLGLDANASY